MKSRQPFLSYSSSTSMLIVLLLILWHSQAQLTIKIYQSSTTISTSSSQQITIIIKNLQIVAGSSFLFQYSSAWSLGSVTGYNSSSDYCETGCTITGVQTLANNLAGTVQLKNLLPRLISAGQTRTIRYTLKNVVNPSYALSQSITVTLLDDTGSFADITTSTIYSYAKQISCSVSRSVTTVSTYSQYQFQINPLSLSIASNVYIIQSFPSSWSSSTETGTYNPLSYSCRGAPNPSISCSITNNNLNITSLLSSSTSSSFAYNITNVKNPGSQQNNNQMLLQFYVPTNKQIAYCTITITGTTARVLSDLSIDFSGALGSNIIGKVMFSITEKARTTDIVKIELPKLYDCSGLYAAFVYVNGESVGNQAVMNIDASSSPTLNILSLQPFFSDSIANYKIQLYNIGLPKTTAPIGQIKVSISRDGALIAYQTCCANTYSQLASTTGLSLGLSTYSVGSASTHYISISSLSSLTHPFAYSYIMLQLDSKYTLSSPTYNCYMKDSLTLIYPLTCARNTSTKILVSNFNKSVLIGNSTYTIGIDGIVLPVTLDTLSLSFVTMDAAYYAIESMQVSYSLVATKIQNVKAVPMSYTTYATTTYTFIITNTNTLPLSTKLSIKVPPQIRLSSSSICYINSTAQSASNCLIDTSLAARQSILLSLSNPSAINPSLLNQTNISITSLTNPLSLKQSQSFYIQLLTSAGSIIEELKEGVSVIMSTVSSVFDGLNVVNVGNGYTMGVTDYQVQVGLPVDVAAEYGAASSYVVGGVKLVVQFPAQFNCISYSSGSPCLVANQSKSLTYSLASTSTSITHTFSLPSIINPETTTISTSITITLYLSSYASISQQYSSLQSFLPSILSYSLSQSNYYMQEHTIVYMSIVGVTNWYSSLTSKYLVVKVPSQYAVDGSETIACNYDNATITKTVVGTVLSQIVISNIMEVVNMTITISNIVNPAITASVNKWQLQLRQGSATGPLIAQTASGAQIGYSIACSMPCRSCSSNTSYCTSCYSTIASIGQKYLDTVSHTCSASCQSSQYLPLSLSATDLQCYACSSSCLTCMNISSNCTSCTSSYLYQPLFKCVTQCPPQYYQNTANNKCTICASPCLYCTGSTGSTCKYCIDGHVLTVYLNGTTTCALACGIGFYNHSNVCTRCSTNCNVCTVTNVCTTCSTNYYLYNGTCVAQCPRGLYISLASSNTVCQACQSPCTSCMNFSTYCLSCSSSSSYKYLHTASTTSTCELACPNGYYYDEYNVCNVCVYPCQHCSSAAVCASCVGGFYYNADTRSCYSVCPTGTILVGSQCQKCISPCLQCTSSATTCTSCIQAYFLDTSFNTCNATCTLPYYAINRKCSRCADPCLTCALLQPYTCSSCLSGYYLMGTTCYPNACPDGTYRSGVNTCAICTSGCLTCANTSSTCLSCYPGLYLYQQSCLPSCPTTPTLYYQYQRQCIACQPQCTSCLSSPVQCSSCSNSSLYFNQVTRECSLSCASPYYPYTAANATKLCIKCALPCKTCTSAYNKCGSCYNGLYLYNQECIQNCGTSTYADVGLNACVACSSGCLKCTSVSSCTSCQTGTYVYRGACYSVCPAQAEFVYMNKYCRNCTLDYCLLCDMSNRDNPSCLLCQPGYYLYEQQCTYACPDGYEPDAVTQTLCIITEDSALLMFLKKLQKYKVWLMPGSVFFIIYCLFMIVYLIAVGQCVCKADYIKQINRHIIANILHFLPAVPQFISILAYLTYNIIYPQAYYRPALVNILLYAAISIFVILNIVQFVIVYLDLKGDKIFIMWCNASTAQRKDIENAKHQQAVNGREFRRYLITMLFSLFINRKVIYFLFSGIFRIPLSCCQISAQAQQKISKKLKIITFIGILFVQIPLIAYSILNIIIEKHQLSNYKLFYGGIDTAFINSASIIFEIVFLSKTFQIPSIYRKYILQGVSNRSLAGYSQKVPEQAEDDDDLNLHRSNSAQGLKKQSEQMKAIQYKSAFDTDQYQDFDFIEPQRIQHAIDKGKFRKKNLKKKKKNGKNLDLDIIDEDSQQSQEEVKKKKNKKKPNNKKLKLGYLNNFIYWKPPQKVQKKQPQKQFKMHKQQIMQTIRQKQSDFDTITRNDIIFQQEAFNDNSSHDSDPNFQIQDSRRALNYQYQTFINKNYAKRRHL